MDPLIKELGHILDAEKIVVTIRVHPGVDYEKIPLMRDIVDEFLRQSGEWINQSFRKMIEDSLKNRMDKIMEEK